MSVNNMTRGCKELKKYRRFARVFRGATWIQVRFGNMPKPARYKRALPRVGSAAPFFLSHSFACFVG